METVDYEIEISKTSNRFSELISRLFAAMK